MRDWLIWATQWRQRSVTLGGGWIDAKGKVFWGTEVTQWGSGAKTQLVDEPPKLIFILEIDVKLVLVLSTVTNPVGSL